MKLEFVPYTNEHLSIALEIFDSNVPDFLHPDEKQYLLKFLDKDVHDLFYYILFADGKGAGMCGYAIEGRNKGEAVLCWGMLHRTYHGKRLGEAMLKFRIDEIKRTSPGLKIVCRTSQVTEGFFARYGFKTIYAEDNYWGPGMHLRTMNLENKNPD